jgi:hypothetical protein
MNDGESVWLADNAICLSVVRVSTGLSGKAVSDDSLLLLYEEDVPRVGRHSREGRLKYTPNLHGNHSGHESFSSVAEHHLFRR